MVCCTRSRRRMARNCGRLNTAQDFKTVNGITAKGGSLGAPGPVIVGGTVYVGSGYIGTGNGMPGNVLLAFWGGMSDSRGQRMAPPHRAARYAPGAQGARRVVDDRQLRQNPSVSRSAPPYQALIGEHGRKCPGRACPIDVIEVRSSHPTRRSRCKFNKIGCPSLGDTGESRSRNAMRPPTAKNANSRPSPTNSVKLIDLRRGRTMPPLRLPTRIWQRRPHGIAKNSRQSDKRGGGQREQGNP